jgi:hypothetical protein
LSSQFWRLEGPLVRAFFSVGTQKSPKAVYGKREHPKVRTGLAFLKDPLWM